MGQMEIEYIYHNVLVLRQIHHAFHNTSLLYIPCFMADFKSILLRIIDATEIKNTISIEF